MEDKYLKTDILIIGGGSAGCLAAIRAKELNPTLKVTIFEKGHIRRSGSICRGMDALNIVAVPGVSSPETYLEAITESCQGIVDAKPSYVMAKRSYKLFQKLERWGVKFPRDGDGNYQMHKLHSKGKFGLAMDEPDLKVILANKVFEKGVEVLNRTMATMLLSDGETVSGALGIDMEKGELVICSASAIILASGGCARFGLPSSGYLYGTFDYPGNAGDGYSLAFHAGAKLTGMEFTRANTLIKDLNSPLLYICLPRGAKITNGLGDLLGQDGKASHEQLLNEVTINNQGPVFVNMQHLPKQVIEEIKSILFTVERPIQQRFFENRGVNFETDSIECDITEFQLCGGHGMTGLLVNEKAEASLKGLYAAGDVACVPKQYLTGAFVFGEVAAENAVMYIEKVGQNTPDFNQVVKFKVNLLKPLQEANGPISITEYEYKVRRIINDYVVPPKTEYKLSKAIWWMQRLRNEFIEKIKISEMHELTKALEILSIIDCAELSARASLERKESRWGFLHKRIDYPERDDANWLKHIILQRQNGIVSISHKPIEKEV